MVTVLVVEDEEAMRECAADAIVEHGYLVHSFVTADAAMEFLALRAQEVGAVFTDVGLPGRLDGMGLVALIRERWPEIRILVTSGDDRIECLLPTKVEFVIKPWRLADVLQRLDCLLSSGI